MPLPNRFPSRDPLPQDRRQQLVVQHLAGAETNAWMVPLGTLHRWVIGREGEPWVIEARHRVNSAQ
jgi:hypothetical protein